jgi:hypothetical protein
MTYMKRVYEALGYEPPDNSSSIAKLGQIENILGRPLPPAVKEWYSKEKAVEIMASRTCDRPVPLSELGDVIANWYHDGPRDFLAQGRLFLMTENQGVSNWVVDLAGGDDPEVLVEVDSSPNNVWKLYSPHFSEWVYTVLIDWPPTGASMLCAQDISLADSDLAWLRDHMESGPVTYSWPCPVNYRFGRLDQRVLIWACEEQADWHIWAASEQSLRDLATKLWGLGGLSESLYSTDETGQKVLDYLRT